MLLNLIYKIFGKTNKIILNSIYKIVKKINNLEYEINKLTDNRLSLKTIEFKNKLQQGISINNILPEAFAVVREVSKRLYNMRHFDVQLLGGIVLHQGNIAQMRTGEGKTLTSTLAIYANALLEKGVHIVTVNDYLAKRDAENNKDLFEFLGMTVGVNLSHMNCLEKKAAYNSDITYGTNNEYGFDYLRDNMVFNVDDQVQRKLNFALIDEIDSILIDEARTPLIISDLSENNLNLYNIINKLIPYFILQKKHINSFYQKNYFSIDLKLKQINFTEKGLILIEKLMVKHNLLNKNDSLYSSKNILLIHYINCALKAHILFKKNVDYIIKNNEIIIIDEHTGRTMHGRRWSEGLHQAIEAKENLPIKSENQTLASITFQNYFKLYNKLSGMTGTAETESEEFKSIYKLSTIIIPTNKKMIRKDLSDLVFMSKKEKINAIIKDIKFCINLGRPILVGTISIKQSELISKILNKLKIKHKVLNAKYHEQEAKIISQAGKLGSVTIATNMAGRGTDIILGGNFFNKIKNIDKNKKNKIKKILLNWKKNHDMVVKIGGLHVIGTERHESRRIDNQLRGRSGRQGDPGSSRFYLSMQDKLMRIFLSENIINIIYKLGIKFDEAIEHKLINKAIFNAQKTVENHNFEIRKQLLEFDNVTNEQRNIIYTQRNILLNSNNLSDKIKLIRKDVIKIVIDEHISSQIINIHHIKSLKKKFINDFNLNLPINLWFKNKKNLSKNNFFKFILEYMNKIYNDKIQNINKNDIIKFEKEIFLKTIDLLWREHLISIEYLRQGIHLRGYINRNPQQEYKKESFTMFENLLKILKYEVISILSKKKFNY